MARPIDSLLEAFETHYTMSDEHRMVYTDRNRSELVRKYMWISAAYMLALYDAVTTEHPASLRSLPDIAVIEKAMSHLDRPETYRPPEIEDTTRVNADLVTQLMATAGKTGNERERQRVRDLVAKGRATLEERHWIHCIDDLGGKWRPMALDTTAQLQ